MKEKKSRAKRVEDFTPAEQRAARAARVEVSDAEPYGWIAHSEADRQHVYHLFCEPHTKRLVCICADFVYRGDAEPGYECKHVSAVLKYVGHQYLQQQYDPRRQYERAA